MIDDDSDKLTRLQALAMMGLRASSFKVLERLEREGLLTPYRKPCKKSKGRPKILYDRAEVEKIVTGRNEQKAQRVKEAFGTIRGPTGGGNALAEAYALEEQARKKTHEAWDAFQRETLSEPQARKALGVHAHAFMQLLDQGIVRARRMYGEERYEREDVMKERDRQAQRKGT